MTRFQTLRSTTLASVLALALAAPAAMAADQSMSPDGTPTGLGGGMAERFTIEAASSNITDIKASELAIQRSPTPTVREYATQLLASQQKAQQELTLMAGQAGKNAPMTPNQEDAAQLEEMAQLDGAAFDRAYLDYQVTARTESVSLLGQQAADSSDQNLQRYAKANLPEAQAQLEQAKLLAGQMGVAAQ
ncbi:DUF4142 domain-containing protein [Zavarzinia sp. CC-PAN008]|uniref:DUF4142 domain-containing protein n=1 Tax=Zavarzinia sp. CC-PAN008 TaxID=3243332 RepID=UPI003F7471FC